MRRLIQSKDSKFITINNSKKFKIIKSTHSVWVNEDLSLLDKYKGISFVNVYPSSDSNNDFVMMVKDYLFGIGVEAVKVMPIVKSIIVTKNKKYKSKPIRDTVIEYGKRVKNSSNKRLLLKTLNYTMDQVGL